MSRNANALTTVRQFQSETDEIREAAEPLAARATLWVLLSFLAALVAIMFLTRVDRVVSSAGGKIVPLDRVNVLQALDPSIIKTIDVREGDQVTAGQLLATLDSTFTSADVTQYRQQVASLEAQVLRDRAELTNSPLEFPKRSEPEFGNYASLQKALYEQRKAQYAAQFASFDGKISQTEASIQKLKKDDERYTQRNEVLEKIENMRIRNGPQHALPADIKLTYSEFRLSRAFLCCKTPGPESLDIGSPFMRRYAPREQFGHVKKAQRRDPFEQSRLLHKSGRKH